MQSPHRRLTRPALASWMAAVSLALGLCACSTAPAPTCDASADAGCTCTDGRPGSRSCAGGSPVCVCADAAIASDAADALDAESSDATDAPVDVPNVDVVEACVPQCTGHMCGDDGCGHPCGYCSVGFQCTTSAQCELDTAVLWRLEVVDGMVPERTDTGGDWDPFGGAPDPLVCVTIGTNRQCSGSISDTISPVWNYVYPTSVHASDLMSNVRFEVQDYDPTSSNDVIGDATTNAQVSDFIAPVWTVHVGRATVRCRLTVAP